MAQLVGPILFTGSIGNIRCYYDNKLKRYIVSTKGGATKEQILHNPAFARTRENMSEFKVCNNWASQLRRSLLSISHLHQGHYFGEIVALAKIIQKHDDLHVRGIRSIESSKAPRLLQNLNFNKVHPFDQVISHQYGIFYSEDKKTITFKMLEFKSFSRLNWPVPFQRYRIVLVIAQMPDHVWNEKEHSYLPVIEGMERLTVTSNSEWYQCSTNLVDIIMTASFAQPALQHPGTTVVVALGIEISANAMSGSSITNSGVGTMKIVECFV